ncbi:MAG: exosortase/archaeosortase family protein [Planctomycetota bacterium]
MSNPTDPARNPAPATVLSASTDTTPAKSRLLLLAGFLGVLAILAGFDAWADIAHIAMVDEEASQVFLTPVVLVWLLWARKRRLADAPLRLSAVGLLVIAVGAALSVYGYHSLKQSLWHGGAVLVLLGAVWTALGSRVIRIAAPAVVVLIFLIPVPGMIRQAIALPLQTWTAAAAEVGLQLVGISVGRAGNVIIYNGEQVAVAEACNGMRMIFALILVAYAYAFATPLRGWTRLTIVLLSPFAAVVCNVIRLVPTVYIYGHYRDTLAKPFHDYAGWAMLGLALAILIGLVHLLRWAQIPVMQDTDEPANPQASNNNTPKPPAPPQANPGASLA